MRYAITAMFFLSGVGALVFENVWFSQTGLVVGNSVWSAALVVGAFMAGLALGNAAAVPLSRRLRNPVRAYAAMETIAALSGALLVAGFPFLPVAFRPLLAPFLEAPAALGAVKLAIAFGLMAIPATALGTTLPLLARPLESLTGNYGYALGQLYGFNTLGAVAGALLAELWLVPALGLRNSGLFAAGCSLSAAAIAWRLSLHGKLETHAVFIGGEKRILLAAFLAGGVLLALEVVWFRFLLLFQDGTTLIFAVMLAVVLGGIGLGGIAASYLSRRGRLTGGMARAVAAGGAMAIVVTYAAFDTVARLLAPIQGQFVLFGLLLSLFLMAPVAILSGVLFTALGAQLRQRIADAGATTGVLTFANTLGAMLGSLAAAFVLLPALGMERSFFLLAVLYGAIALVVPAPQASLWRAARPALAAAVALALFPFGTMTDSIHRRMEKHFGGRLVAAREGPGETVFYLSHEFFGEPLFFRLATNSYSMASTSVGAQRYMKLFAYLPAALHPRIEQALVICFGVGATAAALTDLPEVRRIDVVDVSRDILEMSDIVHPDERRHPLRDPRVQVHVEDGRFYLQQTGRSYDLITGEPPPPKMAGVSALYTREYFELMKDRLNPGGMATYWLPAHLLLESEAAGIIRAFCDAFEDCSLWSGVNLDWILVGSRGGIPPVSKEQVSRLWALQRSAAELGRIGIDGPAQLAGQFMADAAALRELTAQSLPLVDDFPRRIGPAFYAEPSTPRYVWLMDARLARKRLERANVLPAPVVAESAAGFRRREILQAALYPALRPADYNFWRDVAELIRGSDLVELPRWVLGSGASVARSAARAGAAAPLAAEHLAIDALANRRPAQPADKERFMAMSAKGQLVTAFHHCLEGRSLLAWIPEERRSGELYRSFILWATKECALPPV
jgi:predicted membrane-bound spermidine synthase